MLTRCLMSAIMALDLTIEDDFTLCKNTVAIDIISNCGGRNTGLIPKRSAECGF